MPVMQEGAICDACPYDQADQRAGDHALSVGAFTPIAFRPAAYSSGALQQVLRLLPIPHLTKKSFNTSVGPLDGLALAKLSLQNCQ